MEHLPVRGGGDAWVREGGCVGMLTGMRKLRGNKA